MVTVPFPVPLAPLVMDIQLRSEVAVQAHWLAVVTPTDAEPPAAGTESVVVESVKVHAGGGGGVGPFGLSQAESERNKAADSRIRELRCINTTVMNEGNSVASRETR